MCFFINRVFGDFIIFSNEMTLYQLKINKKYQILNKNMLNNNLFYHDGFIFSWSESMLFLFDADRFILRVWLQLVYILLESLYVWFLSDHDWSVLLVHSQESYILLKLFYSICMIKINTSYLSVINLLSRYYLSVHNEFLLFYLIPVCRL